MSDLNSKWSRARRSFPAKWCPNNALKTSNPLNDMHVFQMRQFAQYLSLWSTHFQSFMKSPKHLLAPWSRSSLRRATSRESWLFSLQCDCKVRPRKRLGPCIRLKRPLDGRNYKILPESFHQVVIIPLVEILWNLCRHSWCFWLGWMTWQQKQISVKPVQKYGGQQPVISSGRAERWGRRRGRWDGSEAV